MHDRGLWLTPPLSKNEMENEVVWNNKFFAIAGKSDNSDD